MEMLRFCVEYGEETGTLISNGIKIDIAADRYYRVETEYYILKSAQLIWMDMNTLCFDAGDCNEITLDIDDIFNIVEVKNE